VKREFEECNQIIRLLMFGRRSEEETGTKISGKRYRINIKNRSRGQDLKTFIETDYIPLLSEFGS